MVCFRHKSAMHNAKTCIISALSLACLNAVGGCGELGSMSRGKLEWVHPQTDAPRAGTAYLVRGWVGVFSGGIDRLGDEINATGVTAYVFQHDQCAELARTMAQRYKESRDPEPICMIGHSFGSDDAILIARELNKANVPVDLIIIMDAVDETVVPKNVKVCYNYWQPGVFGASNFLRGIPLTQEAGSTGKLYNINLLEEGRDLRDLTTNHINIDEAPKLHKAIVDHILQACPPRQVWITTHGATNDVAASHEPAASASTIPTGNSKTAGVDTKTMSQEH